VSGLHGRRVLVTGAGGLIGSRLVPALAAEGADVHRLARPGASAPLRDDPGDVTTWECSPTDPAAVAACLAEARPAVVVHLAGDSAVRHGGADPEALRRSVEANLVGTLSLVLAAAAAGTDAVIRAGGLEEYGLGPVPFAEDQREEPVSPYSASQVAATHYCRMLQRHLAPAIVTLRLALVYGPGQSGGFLVPSLVRACLAGEDFELTGGEQTRDIVFVDDVVQAFLAAARRGPELRGEIVNVGTGVERRVLDVAETVVRLTGSRTRLLRGAAPERAVEIERLVCRTDRARALLGWEAVTELDDGLRQTIAAADKS
jgi:nucleoside-diphosphate-sugar epimerase